VNYSGKRLLCTKEFFVFDRKSIYYCVKEDNEYFYIANRGSNFNVSHFKLEKGLKERFITMEEYYEKFIKHK
tara:strand:+ start:6379 stop:6594 length:216 start_codon:yes stop_codon:yes gene_type:complete